VATNMKTKAFCDVHRVALSICTSAAEDCTVSSELCMFTNISWIVHCSLALP